VSARRVRHIDHVWIWQIVLKKSKMSRQQNSRESELIANLGE
jgi:hypothetical protein